MFISRLRRPIVVLTFLMLAVSIATTPAALAAEATKNPPQVGPKEGLTPCLAIAADGSPVWPSTTFPPMKRVTVAFRLKGGESGKQLKSKWTSLGGDGGRGDGKVVVENTLDLQGQKAGFLRLALKEAATPGKYRLETTLDDAPWQSIEVTIAPPITSGLAESPADLAPLADGQKRSYDMSITTGPGTSMDLPGVKVGPDGNARAKVDMIVGASDANGTLYSMVINGNAVRTLVVKRDTKGIIAIKTREGGALKDMESPMVVQPLPPTLESEGVWSTPSMQGGQQNFQFFGPLKVQGPSGAASGYVLFSDEPINAGEPGRPAIRGRETVEQHFIPKLGLVREVRVSTLGGRLSSRPEITLAGVGSGAGSETAATGSSGATDAAPAAAAATGADAAAKAEDASATAGAPAATAVGADADAGGGAGYRLVADPTMKGRLGRIKFEFPKDAKASQARVAIFKPGGKDQVQGGFGAQGYEVMPGKYDVAVNTKRVAVEVKSAHNTIPIVGVLRVHAGKDTHAKVLDTDKKTQLYGGYGDADVPLPVGDYVIEVGGAQEPIKIEDGKILEF